jgi:hypothetical protein
MPISILRTLLIRVGQTKRKEFLGKSIRILSVQQAPIIISKTLSHIILLYFYKINKIGYYSIFFWEIAGDSGAFGDDGRHAPTTCC